MSIAARQEEEPSCCLFSRFKFACWVRDGSFLLTSCVVGSACGNLLKTDDIIPQHPEIGVLEIFSHNLSIALVTGFLTYYVALPVFVFNAFFLGISLCLFERIEGLPELLSLGVVHVPLEMLAWLLTLGMSRKINGLYRQVGSGVLAGSGKRWGQKYGVKHHPNPVLHRHACKRWGQKYGVKHPMRPVAWWMLWVSGAYAVAAVAEYCELKVYLGG